MNQWRSRSCTTCTNRRRISNLHTSAGHGIETVLYLLRGCLHSKIDAILRHSVSAGWNQTNGQPGRHWIRKIRRGIRWPHQKKPAVSHTIYLVAWFPSRLSLDNKGPDFVTTIQNVCFPNLMKANRWTILCQRSQDSIQGASNTASQAGVAGPHWVIREIFQETFPVAIQVPHIAHDSFQKAFAE